MSLEESKIAGQNSFVAKLFGGNLILRIAVGIVAGVILARLWPDAAKSAMLLGNLFVQALKAVAPILVLVLVASALANQKAGHQAQLKPIVILYLIGTLSAAFLAVMLSMFFPTTLTLNVPDIAISPPQGIAEVLNNLLLKIVDNPVSAVMNGNFIGILVWGIAIGLAMRHAKDESRAMLADLSHAITMIVRVVIRLAPIGIFGLVAGNLAEFGFSALAGYARILTVLLSAMLIMALLVNQLIVFLKTKRNPYPIVFTALRESGITAFFTRTLNIAVDLPTALLLSVVAALSACGASGVAGGSLLLIPLSCSLFGIHNDIAMQVVAVGFVISILQDSAETALNSSTDVVFTAAVCGMPDQK